MAETLALPCIQCGRPAAAPTDYCGIWPRCVDPAPHTPEFSTMGDGVERSGNSRTMVGVGWPHPPPPPRPSEPSPEADEGNG